MTTKTNDYKLNELNKVYSVEELNKVENECKYREVSEIGLILLSLNKYYKDYRACKGFEITLLCDSLMRVVMRTTDDSNREDMLFEFSKFPKDNWDSYDTFLVRGYLLSNYNIMSTHKGFKHGNMYSIEGISSNQGFYILKARHTIEDNINPFEFMEWDYEYVRSEVQTIQM